MGIITQFLKQWNSISYHLVRTSIKIDLATQLIEQINLRILNQEITTTHGGNEYLLDAPSRKKNCNKILLQNLLAKSKKQSSDTKVIQFYQLQVLSHTGTRDVLANFFLFIYHNLYLLFVLTSSQQHVFCPLTFGRTT